MHIDELLAGYYSGYFPMGDENGKLEWYTSRNRAIFDKCHVHVSRSMASFIRKSEWQITYDRSFEQTIRNCLRRTSNWITEELIEVYCEAFEMNLSHSCEVWDERENLIGGTYGLSIGKVFCAESMFHRKTNSSKLALIALGYRCHELGYELIDAQVMSDHLARLGAIPMSENEYELTLQKFAYDANRIPLVNQQTFATSIEVKTSNFSAFS